jgi:hypothetical protein
MPHFGHMDAARMTEADATLLRARLHLRGGRQRFERGLPAAGIAALYDALHYAMRWYVADPGHRIENGISQTEGYLDAERLYLTLARRGVLDPSFGFADFESTVERSIDDPTFEFDTSRVLAQVEKLMTQLGVLPFDELILPAEN